MKVKEALGNLNFVQSLFFKKLKTMRNTYFTFILFVSFSTTFCDDLLRAQSNPPWDYNLEVFSQPFEQITQDTLGDYEWWEYWNSADNWFLDIGFSFEVMGEVVDELEFWEGDLIFVQPQEKYFVCFGPALIDRGQKLGTLSATHLLAQIIGDPGERVFIIGLDNAGILGGDSSEYVNFQVRLYEEDNSLELHYGPTYVLPESYEEDGWDGPYIGFEDYVYANGVEGDEYLFSLNEDPLNPTITHSIYDQVGLFGTPPEGTVYRFVPVPVSGVEEFSFAPLSAWWTGGGIKVVSRDLPLFDSYELCDFQGRVLARGDLPEGGRESVHLSVPSALSPGLYALTLRGEEGLLTKKVFVGR